MHNNIVALPHMQLVAILDAPLMVVVEYRAVVEDVLVKRIVAALEPVAQISTLSAVSDTIQWP